MADTVDREENVVVTNNLENEKKIQSVILHLSGSLERANCVLNNLQHKKKRLYEIDNNINDCEYRTDLYLHRIKDWQGKIKSARTAIRINNRQVAKLKEARETLVSFLASPVDVLYQNTSEQTKVDTVAFVKPPRATLKEVFESKADCNVCMTEQDGKDIVYMENCTHVFCRSCVTRSSPQYRCMICRQTSSQIYMFEKCGERYKVKCLPLPFNFVAGRPISVSESGQLAARNHQTVRQQTTTATATIPSVGHAAQGPLVGRNPQTTRQQATAAQVPLVGRTFPTVRPYIASVNATIPDVSNASRVPTESPVQTSSTEMPVTLNEPSILQSLLSTETFEELDE